ncbi:DUF3352 domain-containing protein [Patescibacteria group bacterium]|nr:DUF3352 domain-containing protein [Patescibacteria group bacterium]
MSRIRKERQRKKRNQVVVFTLIAVALLLLLGGYIVYRQFFAKKALESYVPENPVFVGRIDLMPTLSQGRELLALSEKFEDQEFFSSILTNFVFGDIRQEQIKLDQKDFTGWIGEEVLFGNIQASELKNLPIMVIRVKNRDKAAEFLSQMNDNLKVKGNVVTEEKFREQDLILVEGDNEISYALLENELLVSRGGSGVKKMIDVSLGKETSLAQNDNYQKTKKTLKGDKEMLFFYFDIFQLAGTFVNQFEIGGGDFFEKVGYAAEAPTGLVLSPQKTGFKMKMAVLGEQKGSDKENLKEKFNDEVPDDLVFYLEGKDLTEFLESLIVGQDSNSEDSKARAEAIKRGIELELGINVDRDLLDLFKGQYALALFRDNTGGNLNLSLILEQDDVKKAQEKMSKVEGLVIESFKRYQPEDFGDNRVFTNHQIGESEYRYLNLPEKYPLDVHYVFDEKKLILSTTETALQNTLEIDKKETLSKDHVYQNNFENVDVGKFQHLIYLEPQAGFKLVDDLTDFDYGILSKETRLLESFGIKSYQKGKNFYLEGYLKIKE